MLFLLTVFDRAIDVITLFVLIYVLMSWFRLDRQNRFVRMIDSVVEPMLSLIRDKLPKTGMIDFSPIVLILGLEIFRNIVFSIIQSL